MTDSLTWDLESIFPGGSQSTVLAEFMQALTANLATESDIAPPATLTADNQADWVAVIERYYDIYARLWQAGAFAGCLTSQDVHDEKARLLEGQVDDLSAQLEALWIKLNALAAQQPDDAWETLLTDPQLAPIAFSLNEGRNEARRQMPPEMEALASDLAANGYHAWGQLYNAVAGLKQVDFTENGKTVPKSLGQLQNTFMTDPQRDTRQAAFTAYDDAWEELAPVAAMALNYQAGYRLSLYKHRGWESVLQEPLDNNRLTQATLDAMWDAIAAKSAGLRPYLEAKAKHFGLEKPDWFDQSAPVGELSRKMTFAEAGDFVVDSINRFNPDIAQFCRMAIDARWVEAEDRNGKRAGAFCTGLPLNKESRIFMTFSGSYGSMSTLAHELGHAYHSWVMRDLPLGARRYTMSIAETASTFNELVVNDASLKIAANDQERLSLLNQKLDDSVSFMMNIRARYDFERAFFAERAKGQLSVDQLSALMTDAQKSAYHDSLAGYFPRFWASKLHFYITRAPFYNFPYTFGYLFSNAVYQRAVAEGPAFTQRYIDLLRDTGSMTTEALAQKHLGVDLTDTGFWAETVDHILTEVDEFVALAEKI